MPKARVILDNVTVNDRPAARGSVVETDRHTFRNMVADGKLAPVEGDSIADQVENREVDLTRKRRTRNSEE